MTDDRHVTEKKVLITGGSGFIGTNLVEALRRDGVVLVNLDIAAPLCPDHCEYWQRIDILDHAALRQCFQELAPSHVIHLAARTDCDERATLDDYRQNTDGTAAVLKAVAATTTVERLIVTSTQFVCGPGFCPKQDRDYAPHTVYGQSKVITEELTRDAELPCVWTIVRPTTIWGPWLYRHRDQFFKVLGRGWYFHPGRQPCIRSWGYVGNVVHQMRAIAQAPADQVDRRTFNVGDPPRNLLDWVNGVSRQMRGRDVRIVPRSLVWLIAMVGSGLTWCGLRFPITLSRYRSMTEDYVAPVEAINELAGPMPYSLEQGISETLLWLERASSGAGASDFETEELHDQLRD